MQARVHGGGFASDMREMRLRAKQLRLKESVRWIKEEYVRPVEMHLEPTHHHLRVCVCVGVLVLVLVLVFLMGLHEVLAAQVWQRGGRGDARWSRSVTARTLHSRSLEAVRSSGRSAEIDGGCGTCPLT